MSFGNLSLIVNIIIIILNIIHSCNTHCAAVARTVAGGPLTAGLGFHCSFR